mgnify:CR=1 FL=1
MAIFYFIPSIYKTKKGINAIIHNIKDDSVWRKNMLK